MSIIDGLEKILEPFLEQEKYDLVDLMITKEAGKKIIRIFLDKDGGILLSDCESMSERIEGVIDNSGLVLDTYVLEVSSPGLDRVLKKEKDFIKFTGKKISVSVFAPIEGQRNFTGPLLSYENGSIKIQDVTKNQVFNIEINKIARARLEPELEF